MSLQTLGTHGRRNMAIATTALFFMSKVCIAANTAAIEYWYGVIGGASLESEGVMFHYEFLLMGTVMGGLRATTILVAKESSSIHQEEEGSSSNRKNEATSEVEGDEENPLLVQSPSSSLRDERKRSRAWLALLLLFRGPRLVISCSSSSSSSSSDDLSSTILVSCAWVIAGSVIAGPLLYHGALASSVCLRNGHSVDPDTAAKVGEYGRTFSIGVISTLALYCGDQVCLGIQAAGLPFLYGGLVYCVAASVAAGLLFPSRGVEGLGLGMSVGSWVGLAGLTCHLLCDSKLRVVLLTGPLVHLRRLVAARWGASDDSSSSAAWQRFLAVAKQFLRLALPLALSNCLSLIRGLIVAASVTVVSEDDSVAYSIAVAYFQTLEIALLGASSAVSSVASFSRSQQESEQEDQQHASVSRGLMRLLPVVASSVSVVVLGLLFGVLPLIVPRSFASFFGGEVYAFGQSQVDRMEADKIETFTWVSFASFAAATVSMVASAVLHGWQIVLLPTGANGVANSLAVGWAVYFATRDNSSPLWVMMASPLCNAVSALLQLALFCRYVKSGDVQRSNSN